MTDHRAEYYQSTSALPRNLAETQESMAAWRDTRFAAHDGHHQRLNAVTGSSLPPLAVNIDDLPPLLSPPPPFRQKHLRKIRKMPPSRYERLCPPPIDWRTS